MGAKRLHLSLATSDEHTIPSNLDPVKAKERHVDYSDRCIPSHCAHTIGSVEEGPRKGRTQFDCHTHHVELRRLNLKQRMDLDERVGVIRERRSDEEVNVGERRSIVS